MAQNTKLPQSSDRLTSLFAENAHPGQAELLALQVLDAQGNETVLRATSNSQDDEKSDKRRSERAQQLSALQQMEGAALTFLDQQIADIDAEIANLNKDLADIDRRTRLAQEELQENQDQQADLRAGREDLTDQMKDNDETLVKLETEVTEKQQQQDEAILGVANLSAMASPENYVLKSAANSQEIVDIGKASEAATYGFEIEQAEEKIEDITQENKFLAQSLQENADQLKDLEKQAADLGLTLEQLAQQRDDVAQKLDALNAERDEAVKLKNNIESGKYQTREELDEALKGSSFKDSWLSYKEQNNLNAPTTPQLNDPAPTAIVDNTSRMNGSAAAADFEAPNLVAAFGTAVSPAAPAINAPLAAPEEPAPRQPQPMVGIPA